MSPAESTITTGARRGLVLACAAILVTAADTYVVVLALPEMMDSVGLTSADLPRAAPIVSLFLLGYIAVLPVLGRLSDTYGRHRVLVGCLMTFAAGSALTAVAGDLTGVVAGRFLQGLGGGGLVPVTLALVADTWPPDRRGGPLGAVGAVQELGSVVGPLLGAVLIALGGWRLIFWTNLGLGLLLAVGLRATAPDPAPVRVAGQPGSTAAAWSTAERLMGVLAVLAVAVAVAPPAALQRDVTLGVLAEPAVGGGPSILWLLAAVVVAGALLLRARDGGGREALRRWAGLWQRLDGIGATLLASCLGLIVLALASPTPETQTLNDGGEIMLAAAAAFGGAFVIRERRTAQPLVPAAAVSDRRAWGPLVVSALIGAALIATLVDVPLFARATVDGASQLTATLVLLRFLIGLPIGALLGGRLLRRVSPRTLTALGAAVGAGALAMMARWDAQALAGGPGWADGSLVLAGLGLGLTVAPINDSALRAVERGLHGLVSALVVVARTVGMLLGLSALTAVGLARFRAATDSLPSPSVLCPSNPLDCPEHVQGLQAALLEQIGATFGGAAVCAAVGALAAWWLLDAEVTPEFAARPLR